MSDLSIIVVMLAGGLSFLSPCILPMVPAYIAFITGDESTKKSLVLKRSLAFVIGFSVIFIAMGASASVIGRLFFRYRSTFTKVSGLFIVLFGLHMMGLFSFSFLNREVRMRAPKEGNSWLGALLMGVAFAAGWTPCVGSVLASILLYAGTVETMKQGVLLLGIYSLGMAIPFMITALLANKFYDYLSKYEKVLPWTAKIAGVIMVLLGFAIFFNKMLLLSGYFNFLNFQL